MQRWDRVEAFVEVVRLGAFKAAAERLKVSSSHVSRLVSQLENQLGTTLLYRTTRRIRLTEAGRLYYQHCQHLVEGFHEAEAAIKDLQAKPTGLLGLTCATTFGERFLAPLVHDFMCRHPRLEVRMHFTNRQVDIIDEGFDIAIRMGTLKDSSLIARRLCERREYVVGSPAYFTRVAQPHSLSELARHRCLVGSRDYWRFDVEGVRREVRVDGPWHGNSGPALLDAALKGLGLAQLPDYYVEAHLARGELISVLDAYRHSDTAVWAVYPRHRHRSPKVRQFLDFLVANIDTVLPGRQSDTTRGAP
ncbi:LysR family transcriptional regulator [Halomonas stenophila]|uniref:DNA-binding transcriptional LysR family regulator n=1 Tax=Halomonas stenophila TaxID=795312 RepID=A0A7W5HKE0_9GAMM|nr:LysR family transcriptional regulator [Halomonas stenophila]MBB3230352.1 DNA-binding transcriptional LysR family regulator [Halomonas stenophila]